MDDFHDDSLSTILIVDDEPATRFMLRRSLEDLGCHLVEAEDGQQALDAFKEHLPDLMLLDVEMPELDGLSVCKLLRKAGYKDTPIIILTSRDDNETVVAAFDAGATDFITKPINWTLLAQRLRYALRNAALLRAVRERQVELNKAQTIAKIGHWSLQLDSMTLAISRNALPLFNRRVATIEKMPFSAFLQLLENEPANELEHLIHLSLEDGLPRHCELPWTDRNTGETRHITYRWHVVCDDQGDILELRGISQDISERKQAEAIIEQQAYYDYLTGLPNRRLFTERLQRAMHNAERAERLIAILFIDCDRFKPINDSYGHHAGDKLLLSIARRLQGCVQTHDMVCRVSGDEFAVLLEDVSHISNIDHVADDIVRSVSEPHYIQGHKLFTSVSIGIAVYPFDDNKQSDLFAIADQAMYHAKQNGGNQYAYYNPEMNREGRARLQLEHDLHEALSRQELQLYYQPQCRIDSSCALTGVEVLLRWQHPKRGLISPQEFIPIAEETGLIVPIGEWVIRAACQQAVAWRHQGLGEFRVAINLSPRQFNQANLASVIQDVIKQTGIRPQQLDFEITESTSMDNIEATIQAIAALQELGVRVALDDFGTGYSSLSYLQRMHIDTLKIDRSFIHNLHKSDSNQVFVRAMITMAHSLGMDIVAEGVETEEQLRLLQEMRCETAQGFLFCPPLPAEQLTEQLREISADRQKA